MHELRDAHDSPLRADSQHGRQRWRLGLRYDRPAIPENLVPLARAIATSIEKRKADPSLRYVREILAQFEAALTPPLFRLFAIVVDGADKAKVRDVLIEAALEVPIELGVMDRAIVGSSAEISVEVLETSFAVDLTQITWASGRPEGAC